MGRRALAWILVLYGLAGVALAVTGAVVGLDVAARVERLAGDAEGTLESAARASRAAAGSFDEVDASLTDAEESANAASVLAADAAGTLRSLAQAMELRVLGAQPLLALADDFTQSADQAEELARMLTSVGGSLGDTRADLAEVGTELETLAVRLESLREASGTGDDPPPIRLFIVLLVVWLLLPALASLVIGLALARRPLVAAPPIESAPGGPTGG